MNNFDERLKKIEERLNKIEDLLFIDRSKPAEPQKIDQSLSKTPSDFPLKNWIIDNWLVGIGILFVMLAGGWFVSYAFANDWIGPSARVFSCFAASIAVYIFGLFTLKKNVRAGQALTIIGQTGSILAIVAGHQLYDLFSPLTAFLIVGAITAITAVIAVIKDVDWLGYASIITAMIVPELIDMPSAKNMFWMNYLILVDIAALFMLALRGWGWLYTIAWLGTFFYSALLYTIENANILYFYIAIFYFLFAVPAAMSALRIGNIRLPWEGALLFLVSTLTLILWVDSWVPFKLALVFYLSAALFSIIVAWKVAKDWDVPPKRSLFLGSVLAFNGLVLLFAATYKIFSHLPYNFQEIPYLIEITVAILVARFYLKAPLAAKGLSLFYLYPLVNLVDQFLPFLHAPTFSLIFANYLTAFSSFAIAAFGATTNTLEQHTKKIDAAHILWILSGIFLMGIVWNICYNLISSENVARGVALIIYTITAEVLIYLGNLKGMKSLRYAGFAIIIWVIIRLLYVEVWLMPPVIRTITFVITGILLIGTTFFDKKFKKIN